MNGVRVIERGEIKLRTFSGSCWSCSSKLEVESDSKLDLIEVKCPVCSKYANLKPPEKVYYHEPSLLDHLFRNGKPRVLSGEY